jgi:hypothetical protein
MQHPNNHETQDCQQHSGLAAHHHHLQGRGYPFHKKLGQLRVAVPKQLASFHSHEQQQVGVPIYIIAHRLRHSFTARLNACMFAQVIWPSRTYMLHMVT